ncbi:hypothetical protein FEE96_06995 [Parasedimentitalea maritima]|uniref:Invasion associated locus B family protein n=1 Tax=Parasedimentitalea maritima TaxID=2578117 RepID=A0ABY2UWU2_9RHOB|nr:hypothetical protein [Zongyanglinia marina]TLP67087.1 hypothetical protein FEE96_06995 [Zongyanglinia marina]
MWRKLLIVPLLVIFTGAMAVAAENQWVLASGTDNTGHTYAQMHIQQGKYVLNLGCDERNQNTQKLDLKLYVPSLPNLFAQDDATAQLGLQFHLPGGSLFKEVAPSWYFDGDGDDAWVGNVPVSASMLNAFAAARKVDVLNPNGELVLRFSAQGTAAAVDAIRSQCGIGLT